MSSAPEEDKGGPPHASAAMSWWLPPRLLTASLLLALLFVWTLDSSAVHRAPPTRSIYHPRYYLGTFSAASPSLPYGWVYSAHCSFRIFTQDSAWECLRGRWLFFWGDSNHVDTIRNLLNFVLGLTEITSVPRRFDMRFPNPRNGSESVRITSIFNGHWNDTMNYLGLQSLRNDGFRELLRRYFSEDRAPDALILNSGLHDGVYWKSIRAFAEGAEHAARFWEEVMRGKVGGTTRVFYRTTIAVGGYARDLAFNPAKLVVAVGCGRETFEVEE